MIIFQSILVRSVFWLLAWTPLLFFRVGRWSALGCLAAAATVSVVSLSRRGSRFLSARFPALLLIGVVTAMVVAAVVSAPGFWLSFGCPLGAALMIHQIMAGFSLAGCSILAGQALSRWTLTRLLEAICMTALLASVFAAHRYGMIQQPAWMVDVFVERNWNVLRGLRTGGLVAALVGMLYLVLSDIAAGMGSKWKRLTMVLVGIAVAWSVSDRIEAPAVNPPRAEPPPPMSSDLPPPPPPPDRVALVIFQDWFRPSQEIFFSIAPAENAGDSKVDNGGKTIRSEVHLLGDAPAVPALVRSVASEPLKARKPFVASFKIVSIPSSFDPTEVLAPEEIGNPLWTQCEKNNFLEVQPHQRMDQLVADIIRDELLVGGKIARIRDWLEKNIPVSEKAGSKYPGSPFQDLITGRKPCGMEQASRALVDMLRRAGIAARSADGFVYAPGPEFKKEVLLTSQHRQHWAEVYLGTGGWTPLPLHPENVLDKADPVPQPDLEDLLARLNDQQFIAIGFT